jgi:exoribonuclease R
MICITIISLLGLEFDVLFLSTVRTSRMLGPGQHEGKDLGFLSNPKLLNTAITRAKFCLVVIGDPKALCSVGDCRVCWKTILSLCSENGTFHYRVPLTQVLSAIREEQTHIVPPGFNNSLQKPYQRLHIAPPISKEFPLFPIQMGAFGQVPSVTSMTLPLHRPGLMSPIIPATLSTPLDYQSQVRLPAASYNHVVRNHITGSMANIYTPSEVHFQPTSPQKATPPGVHASAPSYSHIVANNFTNRMGNIYSEREVKFQPTFPQRAALPTPLYPSQVHVPAASYSYMAGNHINDSTRNVQASTEINLQSTSSESASLLTPRDDQAQTPAPAASYYHTVGNNVNDTMRNLKPPSEESWQSTLTERTALPTARSTESTLPSSGDSKHHHSNQNRSFNPFGYNELPSSANGLDRKAPGNECSYPGNIFEESRELSLPATQSISPTASEESPILSLCQTLRHNIANSLRNITVSEETVNMFIENPLEDISVEMKENLVSQVSLLQQQKSSLEQQQVLNRTLAKSIRSFQEISKQVNNNAVKDRVLIEHYLLKPSPRLTHVHKINLDSDNEVQEWYRLRRQDPIVQDYIKSFEMLSERARTRGNQDNQMTESCDISDGGNTKLAQSLRGWVLQPQSVVYPSGNSLYEEYLSTEEVAKKLQNGELVSCTLSVDRSSSGKSATCVVDDPLEKNILVPDRQNMNRAFNTDYVAVEITQDLEDQDLREGKVVAILQERHHRQVVCRLASSESTVMIPLNNTNPKFSILQSDNHVGQTGVAVFDTQGDQIHFQHFVSDVQDKLFLVQFLKWDVSYRYPLGFVAKCFDQYSDLNSLIPILCSDYGIPNNFPVAASEETEARFSQSWRVPDVELKSRCRYEDAFTIDSEGAEELDDAISVRPVKYGIYSVTIHVADVSYFVSKGSLVDKTAQERATSLYVIPPSNLSLTLLPKRLSHICSLLPGKERLAVSVEFVIDSNGNILRSPIFRRSIVVSQRQLSFEEVDGFLSGLEMAASRTSSSPLLCSLQVLCCLSRELWARRVRAGSFQACAEVSMQSTSRRIVEELMIITNMAVAEKLSKFPDSHAVPFRVQQLPKYSALQSLASWAADNDLNLNEMWLTQFLTG